jgi:hypothetical protein
MNKKTIEVRDPVVESVINKLLDRSNAGYKKYGSTMRDDRGNFFYWLNHLQEEMMDAVLYLQKAKQQYEATSSKE